MYINADMALSPQVRYSGCGMAAFNGARCVICGMVDDD